MLELAFDLNAAKAKESLEDAVRMFMPQAVPPKAMPQQPQPMAGIQGRGPGQASIMGMLPLGGGASLMGNANVGRGPQGPFMQGYGAQMQMPVAGGGLNVMANLSRPAPNMPMRPDFALDYQKGNVGIGAGYTPEEKALMLRGRVAFAKGGGAWTRKEGQNPEGGLNAKGRASLRAQGHDIKPPVSAKQAKKSPKAAARRKSFCARMSGMPGPMKDEKGRPTRKALSLRKWDCR